VKRLLRSIIDFDEKISSENLVLNFQKVFAAHLDWGRPDDEKIYQYCTTFFQQRLELPSGQVVKDYFENLGGTGDLEVLERLKDIEVLPYYIRTNFLHLLDSIREEQAKAKTVALLKETHDIITRGVDFRDGRETIRKQGVREGITHFSENSFNLIHTSYNARTSGNIREDGQLVWEEYQTAKVDKHKAWGKFTGLNHIDRNCHGVKKGELWIHAAFPGELKTSLACNWVYNLATRYRTNCVYWSFEMPYEQVRRLFYAMHSGHLRWRLEGYKPLDYRKIRDGELSPEEELFYQKVIDDFNNNPEYCEIQIICPDHDVNMDEVRLETEMLHKRMEVGFIVLDHGQLIEARKVKRSRDYVVELNSIVRDCKKLALHFNQGEKIPVLLLFQINRNGKDEADKNGGIYKPSALTYANECEKSADVITTTYLNDEHRANGTTLLCNLKNRDNPKFEPFLAKVDFEPRRLYNLDIYQGDTDNGMTVEEHKSALDAMLGT
jgi:replicative DNA helicase